MRSMLKYRKLCFTNVKIIYKENLRICLGSNKDELTSISIIDFLVAKYREICGLGRLCEGMLYVVLIYVTQWWTGGK